MQTVEILESDFQKKLSFMVGQVRELSEVVVVVSETTQCTGTRIWPLVCTSTLYYNTAVQI